MRVLTVINSLVLAGAERLVFDLVPRLEERGVEITLAILQAVDSPLERELRAHGVRFLPVAGGGVYSPRQIVHLARNAVGHHLVHAHLFPAQFWTALAALRWSPPLPLVITEHGTTNLRRRWWFRPVERWMYSRYDRIFCNSDATARSLIAWVPGVTARTTVVPNGIDLARFTRSPRSHESRERYVLTFIARLDSLKDHDTLFRAMTYVPNADLQLVGVGPREPTLRRLAAELRVSDRVQFLGHRTDVPELLQATDIYVHCSHSDGFGIAVAEAMAAGCAVVSTRNEGLEDVVGDAGFLVPPGDFHSLAGALRRLLASSEERQRLGALAQRQVQQFSIEATADEYVRQYREVLAAAT
ncbi:MAG: glycosyltransferase family 4 protein [Candidatus Koribacter versatilis]|uniref:Glycosyltransferase family 4 protein n=1 Tax=Candidatus Korobacter versatilis TaxID=658062 RepID=A0A932A8L0_9BACT|nr:glycosyltransferase family 4 protein [Candidatus Koribacter versatilis]